MILIRFTLQKLELRTDSNGPLTLVKKLALAQGLFLIYQAKKRERYNLHLNF